MLEFDLRNFNYNFLFLNIRHFIEKLLICCHLKNFPTELEWKCKRSFELPGEAIYCTLSKQTMKEWMLTKPQQTNPPTTGSKQRIETVLSLLTTTTHVGYLGVEHVAEFVVEVPHLDLPPAVVGVGGVIHVAAVEDLGLEPPRGHVHATGQVCSGRTASGKLAKILKHMQYFKFTRSILAKAQHIEFNYYFHKYFTYFIL